jgi:hypothetical protein
MKQQRNCREGEVEMSNVKSATNCPECRTKGNLVGLRGLFLKLECPSCKFNWRTLLTSKRGGLKI